MNPEDFYEAVNALIEMGLVELVQDSTGEVRMTLTDQGAKYVATHNYSYRAVA
jgi:hypothetical protein